MRLTMKPTRRHEKRANKRYGWLVGALGLVSFSLTACDDVGRLVGEALKPGAEQPGQGPNPGQGPIVGGTGGKCGTPVCVSLAFDHDVACEDLPQAKDQAWTDCQKRGLVLTDFGPAHDCPAGELRRLKYTCCPKTEAPPPPPPPPPVCVGLVFDHDVACEDLPQAKDQAWTDCQKRGLVLTDFGPAHDCPAGELRRLKYTCCPKTEAPPPPPPRDPNSCQSRSQGGETSCKSVAIWQSYAAQDCAGSGYEAVNTSFAAACGDGVYRFVTYACCTKDGSPLPPPAPEPTDPFAGPPVPGPSHYAQYKCCFPEASCVVEKLGDPAACNDAAAWNAVASTACTKQGGKLYGVGLYESCSP